ncbi:hypothetical protein [Wenzhouxiangella marina]|uniref:Uncharacterized protein n=1 Tax=Wenzhouxiangella marina TaxID=1579979 RepID=A0A0K0XUW1_9GAMM|nr:hypothetical protein [Wenzhouxiangella marina]AKS41455.1 hypothetical protein WM2015_1080 [Wenzhouxiangella marina]MBB6086788.1 hypothetical protein [Wenzhouxiangella marina]
MNHFKTIVPVAFLTMFFLCGLSPSVGAQYFAVPPGAQAISNPYCGAPTYRVWNEPRRGGINFVGGNGPVFITVAHSLGAGSPVERAVLAHECGHVARRHGLNSGFYGQIRQKELEADCFAASILAQRRDRSALIAFRQMVGSCGTFSSGPPGYPTCNERLSTINQCAGGM